jgi:leucine dehydrogenase
MTYKAAICGLPYGGGKSVIIGDPKTQKTEALLRAMGRLVETLRGRYIIADDVGTNLQDLAVMRLETHHTAATTVSAQQPLAVTAYGVFHALKAAALHVLQRSELEGVAVAVQGLGNVGLPLCDLLHKAGASLVVTDSDRTRVDTAVDTFGATAVTVDEVYDQQVDIFAPCALGSVINAQTVARLRTRIVCGGANNQLATAVAGVELASRNITFIPDYLAGAGGVIDFHQESIDDCPEAVMGAVEIIGALTRDIPQTAQETGRTADQIGEQLVRERLNAARAARRSH